MATCPDCGGYLSDDHACTGRRRRALQTVVVGVVGGLLGACVPLVLMASHRWNIVSVLLLMFLGSMVAVAVWKELP